jgi:hypothetical protein
LFVTLFLFFPPLALGYVAWETTSTCSSTIWASCLELQSLAMGKSTLILEGNCNARAWQAQYNSNLEYGIFHRKVHIPTSSIQMGMNIIWDYGSGVYGNIGREFPCYKKKGIFFHKTLKHENKFDVYARGGKKKKEKTT